MAKPHLIKLTTDTNWEVRAEAASVLGSVFTDVPDKKRHGMT